MYNSEKYGFYVGYSYIGKNEKGDKMEFPTDEEYEEYCRENGKE